jgi:hypothetical protein
VEVWRQLIVEGASSGPLLGQGVFLVPFYPVKKKVKIQLITTIIVSYEFDTPMIQ